MVSQTASPIRLAFRNGTIECWEVDGEFYLYGLTRSGDPRVCHSIGMARELAAGA